jgi:hypothetical protein
MLLQNTLNLEDVFDNCVLSVEQQSALMAGAENLATVDRTDSQP